MTEEQEILNIIIRRPYLMRFIRYQDKCFTELEASMSERGVDWKDAEIKLLTDFLRKTIVRLGRELTGKPLSDCRVRNICADCANILVMIFEQAKWDVNVKQ